MMTKPRFILLFSLFSLGICCVPPWQNESLQTDVSAENQQPLPELNSNSSPRPLERDPVHAGPSGVRLEELTPYFEEDALIEAISELNNNNPDPAISAFEEWISSHETSEHLARAKFILGYAYYTNSNYAAALPLFTSCTEQYDLMQDYCSFWAARSAEESENYQQALQFGTQVSQEAVFGPRTQYLNGRVQIQLGNYSEAISILEAFVETYPNAYYRNDLDFELASAYRALDQFDDAARIYHRIALLHPGNRVETRAENELNEIRSNVSDSVLQSFTVRSTNESVARAQVLFDRHRSEQVIDLLRPVISNMTSNDESYCDANYLVGKSFSKLRQHSNSIPFYENVIAHCQDEEMLHVRGLYNLGKSFWNADRDSEAITIFERLWTEHHDNSYADDGMLYAARILRSNDDEAGYVAMLENQIATFPDGDMLKDAIWLLMQRHILAGNYREAVRFADQISAQTGENDLYSRGRIKYFRAVSLELLSQQQEARAGYAAVMTEYPMSFYSLLSYNRLLLFDPEFAAEMMVTLHQETEQTEGFIAVDPPEAGEHDAFLCSTELLQLGLFSLAEKEFKRLESAFPNADELGWVISLLYDRVGAYHLSHHVPGERQDLLLNYPTGNNLERWKIAYPRPFWEMIEANAAEREIDPFIILAIMREESGFQPRIESWANARGLLQLMIGTARDMGRLTGRGSVSTSDLFDPAINIELGSMYMRRLSDRFEAHPAMIIGGYNGGQGNIRNWLSARGNVPLDIWVEEIPYQQTRNYVKRVTMTYWVYRWLYAEEDPFVVLPFDLSSL